MPGPITNALPCDMLTRRRLRPAMPPAANDGTSDPFWRSASLHVALVCNPRAGNYSLARLDQLQHAFERHRHLVTRHDSQSFRLDQLAAPVDLICIAGGDGTVRTTIANNSDANADPNAAAAAPPVPYCIFPMGTVNLVAREAG